MKNKGPLTKKLSLLIRLKQIPVLLFLKVSVVVSAQPVASLPLRITFKNMADSTPIQLHETYKNYFGEDYTIHMLKYYISDISLKKADGKIKHFTGSYLINEADSSSKTFVLPRASAEYMALSFLIGVDSAYHLSGVQTGDLDPLNGMFWTWNSGYITAKMEATSTVSIALDNSVRYHIGGFRTGQNTARFVSIDLPANAGKPVSEIVIEANVNKWFSGVHNLPIGAAPVCETPGKLAVQYADNFAKMFTLESIQ